MARKKIGKKLASGYMFQLIKFWRPKPKFHAKKSKFVRGGEPVFPPYHFQIPIFLNKI